jgi:peptide deformylase
MTRLSILEHPDDTLRQTSMPVVNFDGELNRLVEDLFETLSVTGGIGLSAPQVGQLRQVLVVHVPDDQFGAQVYINPELLWTAKPGLVEESCLSVPGIVGNVFRATRLRVRARDSHGEPFEREVQGMHAVCLQHEMDHLDGTLFIDRLSWFRRLLIRRAAAKAAREGVGLPASGATSAS